MTFCILLAVVFMASFMMHLTVAVDNTVLFSNVSWSSTTSSGATISATSTIDRWGATSIVINGLYYIIGGFAGFRNAVNTVEVYDPSTNAWSYKATAPFSSFLPSAVVYSGSIYYMCGTDSNFNSITNAAVYNPGSNTWNSIANVPSDSTMCKAAASASGVFLIVPAGVRKFNVTSNTWSSMMAPAMFSAFQGGFTWNNMLCLVTTGGGVYSLNEVTSNWSFVANATNPTANLYGYAKCTLVISNSLMSFDMSTGTVLQLDLTNGDLNTLNTWSSPYHMQDNSGCATLSANVVYYTLHFSGQSNRLYRGLISLVPNTTQTALGIGDPHFTAFDGSEFDFMGEDGRIYCLYSSQSLHINARFKKAKYPKNYPDFENPGFMDLIGVRYGNHRFELGLRGSQPIINDQTIAFPSKVTNIELNDPQVVVRLSPSQKLELRSGVPESGRHFSILISQHNDDWGELYLNIAMSISSQESSTGLLGQTRRVNVFSFGQVTTAEAVGADIMGTIKSEETSFIQSSSDWNSLVNSKPNEFLIESDDIFGVLN